MRRRLVVFLTLVIVSSAVDVPPREARSQGPASPSVVGSNNGNPAKDGQYLLQKMNENGELAAVKKAFRRAMDATGGGASDRVVAAALEEAAASFVRAADAQNSREDAALKALRIAVCELAEVATAYPGTEAATNAKKAFEATGFILHAGTVYDPGTFISAVPYVR